MSTYSKEDGFQTLGTINSWINNCDGKASIILAILGVGFSILFTSTQFNNAIDQIRSFLLMRSTSFGTALIKIIVYVSFICVVVGISFLIMSIFPRIRYSTDNKPKSPPFRSVMFFGSIAKYDFKEYMEAVSDLPNDKIIEDLHFQIFSASKICATKFQNLKIGISMFFGGLFLFFVMVFFFVM